jgi:hypothetical protein
LEALFYFRTLNALKSIQFDVSRCFCSFVYFFIKFVPDILISIKGEKLGGPPKELSG